jgi:hypothetical protein
MPQIMLFILFLAGLQTGGHKIKFEFGPCYMNSLISQDNQANKGFYVWGGEIAVRELLPGIGLKLRGSYLKFGAPDVDSTPFDESRYAYEYVPVTLAATFNLLPFWRSERFELSLETGMGVYFWKGLLDGSPIEIPTGKMEEKDPGFTVGLDFQVRPIRFLAIDLSSRYHYLTSANLNKYGFYDQDEKIWENGLGLKLVLP